MEDWLTNWTPACIEGVVFKRLRSTYDPRARGGRNTRSGIRRTHLWGGHRPGRCAPHPLGRYDDVGRRPHTGRTTPLPQTAGRTLAPLLTPAATGYSWTGWSFSAGWGTRETLHVTLVAPELVVEVGVNVALDSGGRWRHPATGSGRLRLRVDREAAIQLTTPNLGNNAGGYAVVESKKQMQARGMKSPHRAEAILLAIYEPNPRRRGIIA